MCNYCILSTCARMTMTKLLTNCGLMYNEIMPGLSWLWRQCIFNCFLIKLLFVGSLLIVQRASLKFVSAIFFWNFYFSPNNRPSKTMKKFFISSKRLFSFLRYSNFCISVFPSFLPVSHCFRGWFKKNLKVYDVINCLNKNLITRFPWYLEKEIRCDIEILSIGEVLNI